MRHALEAEMERKLLNLSKSSVIPDVRRSSLTVFSSAVNALISQQVMYKLINIFNVIFVIFLFNLFLSGVAEPP